jgi:hypothetical protein
VVIFSVEVEVEVEDSLQRESNITQYFFKEEEAIGNHPFGTVSIFVVLSNDQ